MFYCNIWLFESCCWTKSYYCPFLGFMLIYFIIFYSNKSVSMHRLNTVFSALFWNYIYFMLNANTSSSTSICSCLVALRLRFIDAFLFTRNDLLAERVSTSLWEFCAGLIALISKFLASTFLISFAIFPLLIVSDFADRRPVISFELKWKKQCRSF